MGRLLDCARLRFLVRIFDTLLLGILSCCGEGIVGVWFTVVVVGFGDRVDTCRFEATSFDRSSVPSSTLVDGTAPA